MIFIFFYMKYIMISITSCVYIFMIIITILYNFGKSFIFFFYINNTFTSYFFSNIGIICFIECRSSIFCVIFVLSWILIVFIKNSLYENVVNKWMFTCSAVSYEMSFSICYYNMCIDYKTIFLFY